MGLDGWTETFVVALGWGWVEACRVNLTELGLGSEVAMVEPRAGLPSSRSRGQGTGHSYG